MFEFNNSEYDMNIADASPQEKQRHNQQEQSQPIFRGNENSEVDNYGIEDTANEETKHGDTYTAESNFPTPSPGIPLKGSRTKNSSQVEILKSFKALGIKAQPPKVNRSNNVNDSFKDLVKPHIESQKDQDKVIIYDIT